MNGNKLLNLRKKEKMSQELLAEKINVSRQTISNWELGITIPNLLEASKIAKIFNITIEELMINDSELQNNNESIKNENLELFKNKLRPFFSEISYNTWIEDIKNIKIVNSKLIIHVSHNIVKSHLENHCSDTLLLNFNKMIDKNISELEILVE